MNYSFGWFDVPLADYLKSLPRLPETKYVLVTSLDSMQLSALVLSKFFLKKRLFGFDEMWFFGSNKKPIVRSEQSIVSPNKITEESFAALLPWLEKYDCTLGLGDGEGTNFVVKTEMAASLGLPVK